MDVVQKLRAFEGLITVRQVSAVLSKDRQTIYRWAWDGRLPHLRIGSRLMFDPARLADWLEARSL
jgi:excisionase family DNA binding protein